MEATAAEVGATAAVAAAAATERATEEAMVEATVVDTAAEAVAATAEAAAVDMERDTPVLTAPPTALSTSRLLRLRLPSTSLPRSRSM